MDETIREVRRARLLVAGRPVGGKQRVLAAIIGKAPAQLRRCRALKKSSARY